MEHPQEKPTQKRETLENLFEEEGRLGLPGINEVIPFSNEKVETLGMEEKCMVNLIEGWVQLNMVMLPKEQRKLYIQDYTLWKSQGGSCEVKSNGTMEL